MASCGGGGGNGGKGCKIILIDAKSVNTRSMLGWERGAKVYRWNTRGQKSAAQKRQQLVKEGEKEQPLPQSQQETPKWSMGTSGAEGDPAPLLWAAAGRSAPAEVKTEKLQSIPSVGPPSNKTGRIHSGASFFTIITDVYCHSFGLSFCFTGFTA